MLHLSTPIARMLHLNIGSQSTPLIDMKFILENLLLYSYNQRVVKLEYRSSSIDNEGKIQLNKFELKTNEDLRVTWSTFHCYKTKGLI